MVASPRELSPISPRGREIQATPFPPPLSAGDNGQRELSVEPASQPAQGSDRSSVISEVRSALASVFQGGDRETYASLPNEEDGEEGTNSLQPRRKDFRFKTQDFAPIRAEEEALVDSEHRWTALDFLDEPAFQISIVVVILFNVVLLYLETDYKELPLLPQFDQLFLCIFLLELCLRLAHKGLRWFQLETFWATMDCVIVAMGVLDLWIMPLVLGRQNRGSDGAASEARLLRFLRLLRLTRIFRVLKVCPGLIDMVAGLVEWEMVYTFFWIYASIFMLIMCCAIVLTQTLARGSDLDENVVVNFASVGVSMFTLFQVTTTDNWDRIASPVIRQNPWWRIFFVCFIAFASWVMIAALTGVAADCMITESSNQREREEKEREEREQEFIDFLQAAFEKADTDGNGMLDDDELYTMLEQDFVLRRMKKLGVHLTKDDMVRAWKICNVDGSGELPIEDFVDGLRFMQEELRTRHVVDVDFKLRGFSSGLDLRLRQLNLDIDELRAQNAEISRAVAKQEQLADDIDASLSLFAHWAQRPERRDGG